MPAASGMVATAFENERQRALGMFSSMFPIGAMTGHSRGIIISVWSWRGIFLVNEPVGIAFAVLVMRFFPTSKPRGGDADVLGAAAPWGREWSA